MREKDVECDEDYQCTNNHFCWFKNAEDSENNVKKCLELWTLAEGDTFGWRNDNPSFPDLDDYTTNGRYCESGLAYPASTYEARCVVAKEMQFKGEVTEQPYACDPTNPEYFC